MPVPVLRVAPVVRIGSGTVKRRIPFLACGLLAASVALSACTTFDTSRVATVNGQGIDEAVIEMLNASDEGSGQTDGNVAALNGAALRRAVSNMVQARVAEQVAAQFGIDLTEERANSEADLVASISGERLRLWDRLSQDERNLVLDFRAAQVALRSTPGSAPADLEKRYANPESTGFLCLRFVALESEELARAAYDDLKNGADFATLANNLSPDANGGIVVGPDGGECVGLENFRPPTTPEELTVALFNGVPGEVSAPVRVSSDQGVAWFILLHRPWAEIESALRKAVEASPAFAEFQAQLNTASVRVAKRYGVWDPNSASVVTPR